MLRHEEHSEMLQHKEKMLPNAMAWKKNVAELHSKKENTARQQVTQPNATAQPALQLHAVTEGRMPPDNAQD